MTRSKIHRALFSTLLSLVTVLAILPAAEAQPASTATPVGKWRTIDDVTGKVKSLVAIWEDSGKLYGKVEKLIDPDASRTCSKCEGALKDKPVTGMRILWDLRKDGDQWSGGKVLDPKNGKIYKCYLAMEEGGKKLKLRGFIGFSLLGRTQYWHREE